MNQIFLKSYEEELQEIDDSVSFNEVNIHGIASRVENIQEQINVMVTENLGQHIHRTNICLKVFM